MSGQIFSVDDAWAAAAAAQRVNGEYVKDTQYRHVEETGETILVKHTNRAVMLQFALNPHTLLSEDRAQGQLCREFLQKDLTFRAIKNQLNGFDLSVQRVLAIEDQFDSRRHKLEFAVLACLPASVARATARQAVEDQLAFAAGGLIGKIGDKITTNVQVLTSTYSKNFGIFWIKGVTEKDEPVLFSHKESYDPNTWLTVRGSVKAHRDNLTQLTRVKVL